MIILRSTISIRSNILKRFIILFIFFLDIITSVYAEGVYAKATMVFQSPGSQNYEMVSSPVIEYADLSESNGKVNLKYHVCFDRKGDLHIHKRDAYIRISIPSDWNSKIIHFSGCGLYLRYETTSQNNNVYYFGTDDLSYGGNCDIEFQIDFSHLPEADITLQMNSTGTSFNLKDSDTKLFFKEPYSVPKGYIYFNFEHIRETRCEVDVYNRGYILGDYIEDSDTCLNTFTIKYMLQCKDPDYNFSNENWW
ncbi:MAG: hypothetical protein J6P28_05625 [Treponema sp.]|nr:hypothetical protein [Treponema sp.]MBP5696489.1 hypothetical protein [Treponema sp.]